MVHVRQLQTARTTDELLHAGGGTRRSSMPAAAGSKRPVFRQEVPARAAAAQLPTLWPATRIAGAAMLRCGPRRCSGSALLLAMHAKP